ncbi:unnamed protein product [Rotaria sordida]|uniref:SUEL-type lectin domain-containing protein n=1 Tax=Rotaria sordida TaxID=392033 RepID=A0A818UM90_9BILA|nr:unnamed protein product [Rotaria sordida]
MVACRQSCLHVYYCSDKCEQQHWDKFHQYECSFLDEVCALQDYNYNEYVIDCARLVMRMLTLRLQDLLDKSQNVLLEDAFMLLSHFDEFSREKKNEFGTVAKTLTKYILTRLIPHLTKDNHEFISFIQSFLPDNADAKKVEIVDSDRWLTEMARLCSLSDDAAIIEILKYLLNKEYQVLKNDRTIDLLKPIDKQRGSIYDLEVGNRYSLGLLQSPSKFSIKNISGHSAIVRWSAISATSKILKFETGVPLYAPSNINIIACTNTTLRIGFDQFIEHSDEIIALCFHYKYLHEIYCRDILQLPKKLKTSYSLTNKSLQFTTNGCEPTNLYNLIGYYQNMKPDCNIKNTIIPGILPLGTCKISLDSLFIIKLNIDNEINRKEIRLTTTEMGVSVVFGCNLLKYIYEPSSAYIDLTSENDGQHQQHKVGDPIVIEVTWSQKDFLLHTIPSLQIVTNPLVSTQSSPVRKQIFDNLAQLNAEYVRYAAWFPYPKLAVAELDPPSGLLQCGNVGESYSVKLSCEQGGGVVSSVDFASYGTASGACGQMKQGTCHAATSLEVVQKACIGQKECSVTASPTAFGDPCFGTHKRLLVQIQCNPPQNNTYWDFTYLDPSFEDFLAATNGHSRIIMFSTQPVWLFKLDTPHIYPDNASEVDWGYPQGTELVDDTMQALGDYYGRLTAWYTRGGFFDEYGRKHVSNYVYNWDYTEIFNEIESEHQMSVEYYTRAYDAVIQGIRRHTNNTEMKYVGLAHAGHNEFDRYRYFLNHSNHAPGIPLDMISYHFYASSTSRIDPLSYEAFFPQLDTFTTEITQIEEIRKALSPETRTTIDELGIILPDDNNPDAPQFPLIFWNAGAAYYAYAWAKIARQGIDIVGHSQLVGYPNLPNLQLEPQFPSVAILNWTTGEGTAKYWTSKLLIDTADIDNDQAVITRTTDVGEKNVFSQAFVRKNRQRWMLIVNKRFANVAVLLPGCTGGTMQIVNEASGFGPPVETKLTEELITLSPFAVAVVHMPNEELAI